MPYYRGKLHDSLLFARDGDRDLGAPRRVGWFFYPRVAAVSDSSLALVWAEPDDSIPPRGMALPPQRLTSLWSSNYETGKGWGEPRKLLSARIVFAAGVGAVIASSTGAVLHAVYPIIHENASRAIVVHLRYEDGVWTVEDVPGTAGAVYSSFAEDRHGRLVLVFVAPDAHLARDANSLLTSTSLDEGRTWSSPTVVSHSGVRDPLVMIDDDDVIHILWRQSPDDGSSSDVIRHVDSHEALPGSRWSPATDLRPPPGFLRFTAAIDRCRVIHVAYEDWHGGGDEGDVDYATWDGRWSMPSHLLTGWLAMDPYLMVDAHSQVHLFVLARPRSAPAMGALANLQLKLEAQ